jgi:hypothetical protein
MNNSTPPTAANSNPPNDCEEDLLVAHEVFNHANITTSQ